MNDSTPEIASPREETLHFLKVFARMYRPKNDTNENGDKSSEIHSNYNTAFC